jgi:hypothetical protein
MLDQETTVRNTYFKKRDKYGARCGDATSSALNGGYAGSARPLDLDVHAAAG